MIENDVNWMSGPREDTRIMCGPPHKCLSTPVLTYSVY